MGSKQICSCAILCCFLLFSVSCRGFATELGWTQVATLDVDASWRVAGKIPETLFGLFFEEINHAGAGGIWEELVSNRGFESGGPHTPSNINPWGIIGDESSIYVTTETVSCFTRNMVALRMEVLCDKCPTGGVGIYNPGFWGMNIEEGKTYNLVMYVRSPKSLELTASFTCSRTSSSLQNLASASIQDIDVSNWTRVELQLLPHRTCRNSRLDLTTSKRGIIWFDQVSLMPSDTYRGHGFRKELMHMLLHLKPRFLRFPGGCFVEGVQLRNAFRWKETIGPWEERPGHYVDIWNYWTDDGLGYFEFLQKTLGAAPIWVFNAGISHDEEVDTTAIAPFVKDVLDSIEFARGSAESNWGSVRAAMGHPELFPLKYVAIGNEDCEEKFKFYQGNYLKFYNAIREAYPDIQIISNCDGSSGLLHQPADLYDVHIYSNAIDVFNLKNKFDRTSHTGPKAFVSEYAVTEPKDAGNGSLLASLAEAAFLTGLENNSDIVQMACYAPLFVNSNQPGRKWIPDAIVFNSWQQYGTPSYWMQTFFRESSGALIHPIIIASSYSDSLAASAITWKDTENSFLRVKIVNFGPHTVNLTIRAHGLEAGVNRMGSRVTVLTSSDVMDENSFSNPNNVVPVSRDLPNAGEEMQALLAPFSFTSFDLALKQCESVAEM